VGLRGYATRVRHPFGPTSWSSVGDTPKAGEAGLFCGFAIWKGEPIIRA
jgi:hypothetical protein